MQNNRIENRFVDRKNMNFQSIKKVTPIEKNENRVFEQTLAGTIIMSGIGIHSGKNVKIKLNPKNIDHGIIFKRTDINDKNNIIPAKWNLVNDTKMCTIISNENGVSIATIEHLMFALFSYGIDNCLVEVNGCEIPIMDGSAKQFAFAIEKTGIKKQKKELEYIKILKDITVEKDGKIIKMTPSDDLKLDININFENPLIGKQNISTNFNNKDFIQKFSNARTFCTSKEINYLKKNNLIQGGTLDNALVFDDNKVISKEGLRYSDECVRHKLLDCIGDLALAGKPILANIYGNKVGHEMNNLILRKIFSNEGNYKIVKQNEITNNSINLSTAV